MPPYHACGLASNSRNSPADGAEIGPLDKITRHLCTQEQVILNSKGPDYSRGGQEAYQTGALSKLQLEIRHADKRSAATLLAGSV